MTEQDEQVLRAQAEDARLGMATRFGTSIENVVFELEQGEKDYSCRFIADGMGYHMIVGDWQWEEYRLLGERIRLHLNIGRGVALLHTNEVYEILGTKPEELGHAMCMTALKIVFGGEVRVDPISRQTYLWLPPFDVTVGNIYATGHFKQSAVFDPTWSHTQSDYKYDHRLIASLVDYLKRNIHHAAYSLA